jgi:predicted TIM-barrel fold metal-dependent hydrolase
VRAENDWTSQQVSLYPDRLRGFCGVNPLRDYAVDEIARCAKDPLLRSGIKLHLGNSDVDLDNPEHVRKLAGVFGEADRHGMAIVIHMHPSVTRNRPYGARQARVFLEEVLTAAPHVYVQVAHLCGAGDYDPPIDDALGVFAEAIAHHDPRVARVYFDISGMLSGSVLKANGSRIATRVRQLGPDRILFGSDGAGPGTTPREYWTSFRKLPLSEEEFRTIENNVAAYMKW